MKRVVTTVCAVFLFSGAAAHAQPQREPDAGHETKPATQCQAAANALEDLPPCSQLKIEGEGTGPRRLTGSVECELSGGVKVFAETIEIYRKPGTNQIVAIGNVVFSGLEGHISARRLEYDTATGTG